jgi:hypothetical protein
MENRVYQDAAARERRSANERARSKSSELRVLSDQLLAQTSARLSRGKQLVERHRRRPLP